MRSGAASGAFERPAPAERVSIEAPEVQLALALLLYAHKHEERVDYARPRSNDETVRRFAMADWVDGSRGESLAARFRAYVEEHSGEHVSLEIAELATLMDQIQPGWDQQIRKAA